MPIVTLNPVPQACEFNNEVTGTSVMRRYYNMEIMDLLELYERVAALMSHIYIMVSSCIFTGCYRSGMLQCMAAIVTLIIGN